MPKKDRAEYNAYMATYMAARFHRRRAEVIRRLGGYCWECYETEGLDIDHIDPADKRDSWEYLAGMSQVRVEAEIVKCQLLCKECHHAKNVLERGQEMARGTHGTLSARRYCGPPTCEACKAAYRDWQRKNRALTRR